MIFFHLFFSLSLWNYLDSSIVSTCIKCITDDDVGLHLMNFSHGRKFSGLWILRLIFCLKILDLTNSYGFFDLISVYLKTIDHLNLQVLMFEVLRCDFQNFRILEFFNFRHVFTWFLVWGKLFSDYSGFNSKYCSWDYLFSMFRHVINVFLMATTTYLPNDKILNRLLNNENNWINIRFGIGSHKKVNRLHFLAFWIKIKILRQLLKNWRMSCKGPRISTFT